MNDPLVSIVLPVYNGSRYLRESIDSCVEQTYSNWELILVDDCSTDDTPRIVDEYVQSDHRIKSITNVTNLKLPTSLNRGFAVAEGELLTWTSDDNRFRNHALTAMADYLVHNPCVDIVYSDCTIIDESGKTLRYRRARPPERLPYSNCVGACFLYRRRVHEHLRAFDGASFLAEDWEYWLRAARSFRFAALNSDLYLYRQHERALSQSRSDAVRQAAVALLERHLSDGDWNGDQKSNAYLRLALEAAHTRSLRACVRYLWSALSIRPTKAFDRRVRVIALAYFLTPESVGKLATILGKLGRNSVITQCF